VARAGAAPASGGRPLRLPLCWRLAKRHAWLPSLCKTALPLRQRSMMTQQVTAAPGKPAESSSRTSLSSYTQIRSSKPWPHVRTDSRSPRPACSTPPVTRCTQPWRNERPAAMQSPDYLKRWNSRPISACTAPASWRHSWRACRWRTRSSTMRDQLTTLNALQSRAAAPPRCQDPRDPTGPGLRPGIRPVARDDMAAGAAASQRGAGAGRKPPPEPEPQPQGEHTMQGRKLTPAQKAARAAMKALKKKK
jgi:hypothetical protein